MKFSKAQMVALAITSEAPIHVYGMKNVIKNMQLEQWAKISPAAIYNSIGRLADLGFLEISEERVNNMPPRKVCAITESGQERLKEMLLEALIDSEWEDNAFHIATSFCWALPSEELLDAFNNRLQALQEMRKQWVGKDKEYYENGVDSAAILTEAGIEHIDVFERMIQKFIDLVTNKPDFYKQFASYIPHMAADTCSKKN